LIDVYLQDEINNIKKHNVNSTTNSINECDINQIENIIDKQLEKYKIKNTITVYYFCLILLIINIFYTSEIILYIKTEIILACTPIILYFIIAISIIINKNQKNIDDDSIEPITIYSNFIDNISIYILLFIVTILISIISFAYYYNKNN
jgi:hypothetical protein